MREKYIYSLNEIHKIVRKLREIIKTKPVLVFSGPLGAGKTTLIKAFLKDLGVEEVATSPTFTYLNVYETKHGKQCNHFDLYRLEDIEGFLELGFDEYLNDLNAITLIEWPEIIKPLLKEGRTCFISLDYADDRRQIELDY